MKKLLGSIGLLSVFGLTSLLSAENAKEATLTQGSEIAKISEAFGHLIGKNLENIGVEFDIAQVIKGLQDESAGKSSPMSEMECVQAIASIQEKIFKEQSAENLRRAETFLSENNKKKEVVSLEEGKVQYQIDAQGKGALVESHFSPLVRYTGKYLDGSVFTTSQEGELIALDEIIPGLKAGLIGMKEGEKRTVFIHPDLAYGSNGYLQPNSLLTFEVEILEANASKPESTDSVTKPSHEIAESKLDIR